MDSFCLLCSKPFNKTVESVLGGGEGTGSFEDPFKKLLQFSQHYLSISQSVVLPLLSSRKREKGVPPTTVFCGDCEGVVSSVCKLYKELCEAQLKLAWKLGQLGELFGNVPLSLNLLEKLETQLELGSVANDGKKLIEELRLALFSQCERQFKNGQKLDAVLNQRRFNIIGGSETSSMSDSASIGVCCDVEVDVDIKENEGEVTDSPYFAVADVLGKGHFLCDQSSCSSNSFFATANTKSQPKVVCHQCQKVFAHKYSLEKHLKTIHGLTPTFHCPECDLEFGTRQDFQHHSVQVHGSRRPSGGGEGLVSPSPKKKYNAPTTSTSGRTNRLQQFEASTPKKIQKRSKSNSLKQRQIIPPNWKECGDCFEVFPANQLYYHMKRVHGHGTRHICPEPGCGKEFLFPTGLKRHILHHGEKRFVCHICQKKFSQFATLKKHLESQHNIFQQDLEILSGSIEQQESPPNKSSSGSQHQHQHRSSSSSSSSSSQQNHSHHHQATPPSPYHHQQNAHGSSWVVIPGISSWPGSSYEGRSGGGMTPLPAHQH